MSNKPTKDTAWYAKRYADNFGLHIVPIEPSRKFPRAKDWGNKVISDGTIAESFYVSNPDWNIGIALHQSRMCALDIDCMESFRIICEAFGVDLDFLISETPTIVGNPINRRLEFRVPDGMDLPYVKLNWRPESDPSGEIHRDMMARARELKKLAEEQDELDEPEAAQTYRDQEAQIREDAKQYAIYTVFELRSATDGSQKQNVYPPSIHPDTGEPYRWVTQPKKDWPTPPDWLLTIWREFEQFKPQLQAACPWAITEEIYKPRAKSTPRPQYNASGGYRRVVQEFNNAHSIENALENYGFKRIGKRYLAPSSSTGLPGTVLFPDNRCWIHHASDPLCSDESGHPVSPFDMYCYYEHGGDYKNAVKAAARDLGISTSTPTHTPPPAADTYIDNDTGEVITVSSPSDSTYDDPFGDMPVMDSTESVFTDLMSPLPWASSKGKPLNHHENLAEIARRLNVTLRYNVIKKSAEILIPNQKFSIDNRENASLAWLKSMCSMFEYPTGNIDGYVTLLCDQNQYNPVATWILSKEWDGVSRVQDLLDTISTDGNVDLKNALMRRWLISAVAAAFTDTGISARGVLVLQGAQGIGKTSWLRSLAPASLEVIADGVTLKPDDKDSVKICVSHWLVELGELDATFKKSDIAQLKSFITKDTDEIRLAYAAKESRFARRTVLFGSVNQSEFLNDPTGNTRFWTIACTDINYNHGLDMQQVWAELYLLYKTGEPYHLSAGETRLLNESNDMHTSIDPIEQRLLKELPWDDPVSSWEWQQAFDILVACGLDKPSNTDCRTASAYIRERNGNQTKRSNNKRLLLAPKRPIQQWAPY